MYREFKDENNNINDKINYYRNVIELISKSTDDFLFLLDIEKNENWFFGDVDKRYNLRDKGRSTNTIDDMLNIVHPLDREMVRNDIDLILNGEKNIHDMKNSDGTVEMEYPWIHPELGEIIVRSSGRRVEDSDGMIVLEGYHKVVNNKNLSSKTLSKTYKESN